MNGGQAPQSQLRSGRATEHMASQTHREDVPKRRHATCILPAPDQPGVMTGCAERAGAPRSTAEVCILYTAPQAPDGFPETNSLGSVAGEGARPPCLGPRPRPRPKRLECPITPGALKPRAAGLHGAIRVFCASPHRAPGPATGRAGKNCPLAWPGVVLGWIAPGCSMH